MSWVDHVARMGNRTIECTVLVGVTYLKASLVILSVGVKIILKCIFKM